MKFKAIAIKQYPDQKHGYIVDIDAQDFDEARHYITNRLDCSYKWLIFEAALITEFFAYVKSFYDKGGIYEIPGGLEEWEIERALISRLGGSDCPFEGDSVDRELIRDEIIAIKKAAYKKAAKHMDKMQAAVAMIN